MSGGRRRGDRSRSTRVTFLGGALLWCWSVGATPAHAVSPPTLDDPLGGEAAVEAIGAQLPGAAARNGMSQGQLVEALRTDPTLLIDQEHRLLFADTFDEPAAAPAPDTSGFAGTPAPSGLSAVEVFQLSSRPSSSHTIYLDFDGHTSTGTFWNDDYGPTITNDPFSLDADTANWSQTEIDYIAAVWSEVAEDYAPFDVNVTTEDPGLDGLQATFLGDTTTGIRAVIGSRAFDPGPNVAGVCYRSVFGWEVDTPCYIFTDSVTQSPSDGAQVVSHEVGHSFGLMHDGTSTTEYYRGHGTWGPIMGSSYDRGVIQWSIGEYADANNPEDDLTKISYRAPLVADVEGARGAPVAIGTLPATASGVISTRTDTDVFRITADDSFTVSVHRRAPTTNLDAKVTVYDIDGAVVATADPVSTTDVTLTVPVHGGSFDVEIDGVGYLTPATGYSDYGSIGAYTLDVVSVPFGSAPTVETATTPSMPVPWDEMTFDATASSVDGPLSYRWTIDGVVTDEASTIHQFGKVGTYPASVTVTDALGRSTTSDLAVTVAANRPPVLKLAVRAVTLNRTVPFVATAANSWDPEGSYVWYQWKFGDGATASSAAVSHRYAKAGTYTVTLTLMDQWRALTTKTFTVKAVEPAKATATIPGVAKVTGVHALRIRVHVAGTAAPYKAVPNATVTVVFSGSVSGTATGRTDAYGNVRLTSPVATRASGITAKVKTVTAPTGWVWDTAARSRYLFV